MKISITAILAGAVALVSGVVPVGAGDLVLPSAVDSTSLPGSWVHHLRSLPCIQPETGSRFSPLGLAFDLKGDLFVVDADNSRLLVATDSSVALNFFGGCPGEDAGCKFVDVAVDGSWLLVSDRSGGLVIVLDSQGLEVMTLEVGFGVGGIGLGPSGLVYGAMTLSGSVVIADIYGGKSPMACPVAGGRDGSYPVDCLVQNSRRVLVTDAFAGEVLVLGPLGNLEGYLRGFDFKKPFGLALWRDRFVLASDSELGCVAVFDADGKFLGTFGQGKLKTPAFLAARDDGTVCVADPGKMTIEVFRFDGPSDE
jgi:hypothetical protein